MFISRIIALTTVFFLRLRLQSLSMARKRFPVIKFLASLKLAVFVILSLAIVAAVGTIIEARFDTEAASVIVYRSLWMYFVLGLLCVNLIAVMIDRWPWKARHTGFVLAHIGIIILLLGGVLTQQYGIDGTMYFDIGSSSKLVTIGEKEISVYSTFDGSSYVDLAHLDVNFLKTPAREAGIKIPVQDGFLEVVDSIDYAQVSERVVPSVGALDGAALRFQLMNAQVNESQWVVQSRSGKTAFAQFGPLQIILGQLDRPTRDANTLALAVNDQNSLKYAIFKKDGEPLVKDSVGLVAKDQPIQEGVIRDGGEIQLPWMGFKFKVLRFLPKGHREWEVKPASRPSPMTTPAILVKYGEHSKWVQLNDIVRFFSPDGAYILKYGQKQVDIGESLKLKKFSIGRYQGTRRAMAYESVVDVPGLGEQTISMNSPLKYNGYTFYQASFQENPRTGEPIASILSVNRDPGRSLKYIGSILIVLGIVHLFWFKAKVKRQLLPHRPDEKVDV